MIIEVLRTLGNLAEPSAILGAIILASAIAAIFRYRRSALVLQSLAAAIVLFFGVLPGGSWLALPLETRFASNPPLPGQVAGIIVLGGTERLSQSQAWGQPILSDATPIAMLLALGRRYPEAKLVFSGGAGLPGPKPITESQVVRAFLEEVGAEGNRIVFEVRSRNTYENATFSRDLVQPKVGEQWILVTEAISMPRAVAVFRHAGWNVIPFPAGYLTNGDASLGVHLLKGLALASVALHEWGGLLVYRILGYTDELFPR